MKRLPPILNVLGFAMMLFSLSMLLPMAVALWEADGSASAFIDGTLVSLGTGAVLFASTRRFRRELQPRDGFLLVSLVWTVLPLVATFPFLSYYRDAGIPLPFARAYFEAMSGLTTTAATGLSGLEHLPVAINIWRATMVWIGGMGILVLAVAILPMLGVGGSQVVRAELPGPMKDEKLTPRIASTAKGLYAIYLGMSLLCWLAYLATGMGAADAYAHMAATVGLGGFSTRDDGLGGYDSLSVELVAMGFMLVAGINFATHFGAWRSRDLSAYRLCPETLPFLTLVVGSGLIVSVFLLARDVYPTWGDALRYGMFNTISMATTTGFSNADFAQWPTFAPMLMLLLSCFCASSGSTGGGIKLVRMILAVRQARHELLRILHPRAVAPVRIGARAVAPQVLLAVLAFMLLYGASIAMLTMLMLLSGLDGVTAFTAVLSSLNNTGTGLGAVGPMGSYAGMTDLQLWICTFAMLLGRLELFTVLVLFTPAFWRK